MGVNRAGTAEPFFGERLPLAASAKYVNNCFKESSVMELVFCRHLACDGMIFVGPSWEQVSKIPPFPRTGRIPPKTELLPFPLLDGCVSQSRGNIVEQSEIFKLFTYKPLVNEKFPEKCVTNPRFGLLKVKSPDFGPNPDANKGITKLGG